MLYYVEIRRDDNELFIVIKERQRWNSMKFMALYFVWPTSCDSHRRILYPRKYLPPVYFCLFHLSCLRGEFKTVQILNKFWISSIVLINKSHLTVPGQIKGGTKPLASVKERIKGENDPVYSSIVLYQRHNHPIY